MFKHFVTILILITFPIWIVPTLLILMAIDTYADIHYAIWKEKL